jgi:alpha-methylacyl-CoA racemase
VSGALLDGLRVVTIAQNVPGPVAAARLAELGASVTKVEPPAGDPLATYSKAWYDELHVAQRVICLDLKSPAGRHELAALLAAADLALTSTRPAALARLGLDWETLHAAHPRLCRVAIIGDRDGHADRAGHDLTYQAGVGLVDPPSLPRTLIADLAGAERTVGAALALLLHRERTGEAGSIEIALADAARAFAAPFAHGLTAPAGILGGALPAYGVYRSADGWVAVAALEPHFADRLAHLCGGEATIEAVTRTFATKTNDEWTRWAAEHDLPVAPVISGERARRPDGGTMGGTMGGTHGQR